MRLISLYAAANLIALVAAACMYAGLRPLAGDDVALRAVVLVASLGVAVLVSSNFTDHIVDGV